MRCVFMLLAMGSVIIITGCAGPENKLGRGINNVTEVVRLGELRRSIEQTALWDGPATAYTTGFFRGLNRTVVRTTLGVFEVATFPLPPYKAVLTPKGWPNYNFYPDPSIKNSKHPFGGMRLEEHPVYPASYAPNLVSDALFYTDTSLGFTGGDVAPFIIGSRFRIFDN